MTARSQRTAAAAGSSVRTACPYCGVGCGVLATPDGAGGATIAGDPEHPANFGRLCSKGSALGETLDLEGRLLQPQIAGRPASWDQALTLVAERFSAAIAEHGSESVAIYASGQLLTEDYYVANKLMKGFFGSANIDTNSRLCMASTASGQKRAFGGDVVPGTYEDLEQADLLVLVGSNLAWCHPVLYQRVAAAKAARPEMRVVTVDPRRTATSDLADLELPLQPGSDVALFNGLLATIEASGAIDRAYVAAHVSGLEEALAAARQGGLAAVAGTTGLSKDLLQRFYALWIGSERVVTVFSQGVNQSSSGTDKVNAILNCHLATGRIGKPGTGPFSVTGQPNAMGGREVGGLANTLACHLEIETETHRRAVQAFWKAPRICTRPGLKAVELFRACAEGRIKALWILSTNPAVSLPEADGVRDAIAACPFVVVSDINARTDTTALAEVLLPATGWGEKSGTVTNSERRISRQRAFLTAPGEAMPDWRILCEVARRMGWGEAFAFESPAAIFREHAALSALAASLGGSFDIGALADLSDAGYEALAPRLWPAGAEGETERFFAAGGFFTADGRARALALTPRPPACRTSADYPLRLNSGRVRDHWHTMTRTAKTSRLTRHMAEPFAEIHPRDAARAGIGPADLVEVTSPYGSALLRALVTDRTQEGVIFAPMHWSAQWASRGRVDSLIAAAVDPVSGQPESKASPVRIARFAAAWYGFAVSDREIRPDSAYWARARIEGGWQAELAGAEEPEDWLAEVRRLLDAPGAETVSAFDAKRGTVRIALREQGRITAAFFAARSPVEVARSHVIAALARGESPLDLLPGRPGADRPDPGATVCTCFDVGVNTILSAIESRKLASVEAIGEALNAGSNCGSCRPELRGLLARAAAAAAA